MRQAIQELMDRHGLDAVVATTPENVRFLCGYTTGRSIRLNFYVEAFAVAEGARRFVTLVAPTSQIGLIAQTRPDVNAIHAYGTFFIEGNRDEGLTQTALDVMNLVATVATHRDSTAALAQALAHSSQPLRRVGIDEMGINPSTYSQLIQAFPGVEFVRVHELLRHARAIKNETDLAALSAAACAAEDAIQTIFEETRPGQTQRELVRRFISRVHELGAVPELVNFRLGPSTALPDVLPSDEIRVRAGDLVTWDVVVGYDGYHADTARSAVVGTPTQRQREYYDAVVAGEQAALAVVKPGAQAASVFTAGLEGVRRAGIPNYRRHHCGHGIGLEVYEPPAITPESADVLQEGSVLNVETPYYEIGWGCVMIEDTIRVTADGFEYLTHANRELRVI